MIRAARAEDAIPCAKILGDFFSGTSWLPRLHTPAEDLTFMRQKIGRDQVRVSVAVGRAVGFISRDGDEIDLLYVADGFRGRGLGAALLAEAQAVRSRLGLWTFQANTGARRFYERHGFRSTRMTDGAGNEERVPDVRYEWERPE